MARNTSVKQSFLIMTGNCRGHALELPLPLRIGGGAVIRPVSAKTDTDITTPEHWLWDTTVHDAFTRIGERSRGKSTHTGNQANDDSGD